MLFQNHVKRVSNTIYCKLGLVQVRPRRPGRLLLDRNPSTTLRPSYAPLEWPIISRFNVMPFTAGRRACTRLPRITEQYKLSIRTTPWSHVMYYHIYAEIFKKNYEYMLRCIFACSLSTILVFKFNQHQYKSRYASGYLAGGITGNYSSFFY